MEHQIVRICIRPESNAVRLRERRIPASSTVRSAAPTKLRSLRFDTAGLPFVSLQLRPALRTRQKGTSWKPEPNRDGMRKANCQALPRANWSMSL